MAADIRLLWKRDSAGYEIRGGAGVLAPYSTPEHSSASIVGRGGEVEQYWLEGTVNRVFEDIANADATPEGALRFVNKWGFLYAEDEALPVRPFIMARDRFRKWLTLAERQSYSGLITTMPRYDADPEEPIPGGLGRYTLDVAMRPGSDLPHVFIRPLSLVSFALIEMMQAIAKGAKVRRCARCSNFFTVAPDLGKRSTRTYCSDRCRVATARAKKARDAEGSC
jgi:hypothetical protein